LTDTPSERAKELVYLLPPAEGAVQAVLIPYQNSVYGNQKADPENAKHAGKEIRRLSFIARLKRFLARFQEPKNR
jgi:hypothetical protein